MSEVTTFSSSGEDAITRTIEVHSDDTSLQLSSERFSDYYDIDRTVAEILDGDYKRVALQFPDELLHDSVPIFRALKSRLGEGRELYVLADTSYGSCCVDEVAAQHIDADVVVHYGHACISQTSRLPVIYVFGKRIIDVLDCVARLIESMKACSSASESSRSFVLLRHDVSYTHRADDIIEQLRVALPSSIRLLYSPVPSISYPSGMTQKRDKSDLALDEAHGQNDSAKTPSGETPLDSCTIFYVGSESLSLTNLLMTHASTEVHSYDPDTKTTRLESPRMNRLLMRRYAVVQKARDADVFGILVGTLGVASYLPLIAHLRKLLLRAHKKSYTISVGKLNPAKLANFLEIECFVLVACPENSLIDAKDFLRPIITPYELEVALQAERSWTGRYVLDFNQVLTEYRDSETGDESAQDPEEPVFSLVTGRYRHAKRYGATSNGNGSSESLSAVVLRNQDSTVATLPDSAAAQFLQSRTFRGLETRVGRDAPAILEQGRSGIAKGYQDDRPVSDTTT